MGWPLHKKMFDICNFASKKAKQSFVSWFVNIESLFWLVCCFWGRQNGVYGSLPVFCWRRECVRTVRDGVGREPRPLQTVKLSPHALALGSRSKPLQDNQTHTTTSHRKRMFRRKKHACITETKVTTFGQRSTFWRGRKTKKRLTCRCGVYSFFFVVGFLLMTSTTK